MELPGLVSSVIAFLYQTTLLRWLTVLRGSQAVTVIVLPFWIDLFLLTLVLVLYCLSLHWEILLMLLCQFQLTFPQTQKGMPYVISQTMTILILTGLIFSIIWEMFFLEDIFEINVSTSTAATGFCKWVQVGIVLYIPHHKYQVKPHSPPLFSSAWAVAISFVYTNIINLLHLQWTSYRLVINVKGFLKLPNMFILIK